jgi:hypothetical protein
MMKYWHAMSAEGAAHDRPSFSKYLFENNKTERLDPFEIGSLTSNLIGGGVDTTTSTMLSFVLAAIAFPDAIKSAQLEIDRVVGHSRLPSWEDEKELPFCSAMVKEVLRWRSVAVLGGLPHAPTKDDTYNGYLIPSGTSIMVIRSVYDVDYREIYGLSIVIPANFQIPTISNLNATFRATVCLIPMRRVTTPLAGADGSAAVSPLRNKAYSYLSHVWLGLLI